MANLVEEIQSHNQDMQKPPLSNHGPPSGGRDGGDWKMGGRGEREREQDMGHSHHAGKGAKTEKERQRRAWGP